MEVREGPDLFVSLTIFHNSASTFSFNPSATVALTLTTGASNKTLKATLSWFVGQGGNTFTPTTLNQELSSRLRVFMTN